MAYACRKRGVPLTVFAARGANPLKIERMRGLGATVILQGDDFDQAKDAAKQHATQSGQNYIEDGRLGPIAEGAATMAVELTEREELDAMFIPLGNGSLVTAPDTVPFCLWIAAYHLDQFVDALGKTISAGGDCDTNAAIVGGIVSLSAGRGSIPSEWLKAREAVCM